ncbi:MAG: hypothetical protein ABI321_18210 [Polyangia bacterium]
MRRVLTAFLFASAPVVGCTFHVDGVGPAASHDAGNPATDFAGVDLTGVDLAPPPPADLAGLCNGGPTAACDSDGVTLVVCSGSVPTSTVCTDGCSIEGTPHCKQFDPGGVAEASDYQQGGLVDVVIPEDATAVFNTDTGQINIPSRAGGAGLIGGIAFRQATQPNTTVSVGIFSMKSLTLSANAVIDVVGSRPLSIVTSGDIVISGTIDVLGSCQAGSPIAGGYAGGAPKQDGGNPGGGMGGGRPGLHPNFGAGGGGGGGYGEIGGDGATTSVNATSGGPGGVRFGDLSGNDPVLLGGSGGASGAGGVASNGGAGGSGGGAVQLASNGGITLGSSAIIQASGCHGSPGEGIPTAGGGGGSGGSVLVEARTLQVNSGAIIAANGGAGAGGGAGDVGEDGHDDADQAEGGAGGTGVSLGTMGGNGGHTGSLAGDPGVVPTAANTQGGGGGGGVGRIALKSKTGTVAMSGAILSPQVGETSQGHPSPATVGSVQFK